MIEATEVEKGEIAERIATAWDTSTMDIIERLIESLRHAGIDIPAIDELAKSCVSGTLNDPAAAFALADYTHPHSEVLSIRRQAYKMMLDDLRRQSAKPD